MSEQLEMAYPNPLSHFCVEAVMFEIVTTIRKRGEATSDDVMAALSQATRDSLATSPNVVGACFHHLAKHGKIRDTGRMVRSRRPEARKRKIAVWGIP